MTEYWINSKIKSDKKGSLSSNNYQLNLRIGIGIGRGWSGKCVCVACEYIKIMSGLAGWGVDNGGRELDPIPIPWRFFCHLKETKEVGASGSGSGTQTNFIKTE